MTTPEYQKLWRERNKGHLKMYFKNRYDSKKEQLKSAIKDRYYRNRESILNKQKQYVSKNKERIYERQREYKRTHPEVWKKNTRLYSQRHPDRVKASKKKWAAKNKDYNLMRSKARRAGLKLSMEIHKSKDSVSNFYSWVRNQDFVSCTYCGTFITGKSIHIDHIIPLSRKGSHLPDNFCVSCPSCNLSKSDYMLCEWPACPDRIKKLIEMI